MFVIMTITEFKCFDVYILCLLHVKLMIFLWNMKVRGCMVLNLNTINNNYEEYFSEF